MFASWAGRLRYQAHPTKADFALRARRLGLHVAPAPLRVSHLVAQLMDAV